ncbi:hypothetical protein NXF25_000695 [Crotalus adamanteus]|uniref:Uncharacterized protein n=1 Tax=Crotalus adamanteus TaxID=8729 RepID=A0AAW1C555_CROAD
MGNSNTSYGGRGIRSRMQPG